MDAAWSTRPSLRAGLRRFHALTAHRQFVSARAPCPRQPLREPPGASIPINSSTMTHPAIAFVTGATGFVGSAVARALLAQGLKLRVLARHNSVRTNVEGLPVELVEGDLLDVPSLLRGMSE